MSRIEELRKQLEDEVVATFFTNRITGKPFDTFDASGDDEATVLRKLEILKMARQADEDGDAARFLMSDDDDSDLRFLFGFSPNELWDIY